MDLTGKQILVTGASSGIGRETSILLSELNARVVLAARNAENLNATLERMSGSGHRVESVDLSAADAIPQWLREVSRNAGPFHGLVHCAGIQTAVPLAALSAAKVEEAMRLNYVSAVMLAKAFRQRSCCAGGGSIVFLSSVTGLVGESGIAAYAGSKAALCGLTRSLAMELAREKIRVNCIAAGMVHSEMTERFRATLSPEQFAHIEAVHPLGFGTTRDVANGAAFLLADTGRWITGSVLVIDGGYTAH